MLTLLRISDVISMKVELGKLETANDRVDLGSYTISDGDTVVFRNGQPVRPIQINTPRGLLRGGVLRQAGVGSHEASSAEERRWGSSLSPPRTGAMTTGASSGTCSGRSRSTRPSFPARSRRLRPYCYPGRRGRYAGLLEGLALRRRPGS
jgi:hypothetical protein